MSSPLDGIVGRLAGQVGGGGSGGLGVVVGKLAPVLMGMLAGGGLAKVVSRFQAAGLGSHADSWVGTGENKPITSDHVKQGLGEERVAQVAQELGVSNDEAAGALAHALPEVVNHLTPDGHVPDEAKVDQALQAPTAV